jgi:CRP/FNR family transcriptional regulator
MTSSSEIPICTQCSHLSKSLFCKIEHENLEAVEHEKQSIHLKKGELLFAEGTTPQGLYCVSKGKLKLAKMGEDGKEQILRLINSGDIIGYRALLSADKYNASAYALEDGDICFISKKMFLSLLQNDTSLSLEMMKILGNDLKKAEAHITHLAQKPVRERIAEALLLIQQTYGYETDQQTINAILTREEIANLVGTATETAIRLLSEFKQDGIIELNGKKIKIINAAKLQSTANLSD